MSQSKSLGYEITPHLGQAIAEIHIANWGSPSPPQSGGSRSCRELWIPAVRWHKLPYMLGKRRDARRLSTSSLGVHSGRLRESTIRGTRPTSSFGYSEKIEVAAVGFHEVSHDAA